MWTRSELKAIGKNKFLSNYWNCIGAILLLGVLTGIVSALTSPTIGYDQYDNWVYEANTLSSLSGVITIFLLNPLGAGLYAYYLNNSKGEGNIKDIFYFFTKDRYLNSVIVLFMKELFIFLWSLLLIVPGIIKSYEYRMVEFILVENPNVTWKEALNQSRTMMNGEKGNAFVLDLSFIGWHILSAVTLFILELFYVSPYESATNVELYNTLKYKVVE